MAKLNQIIAIEKGSKSQAQARVNELYKVVQKPALFNGLSKTYKPINEDDTEKLPGESVRVQHRADDVLKSVENAMTDIFAITARKDWTNCVAKADVVVNGEVLVKDAPVSYLLFLEKQMVDFRTFVSKIPLLDPVEEWKFDETSKLQKTPVSETHRTKKTQKPIVLYDATDKHPAQTQLITEDHIAGFWQTVKMSGAMSAKEQDDILERVDDLISAIKSAREAANMTEEVSVPDVANSIFNYLLEA